ncbi:aconitate hydratase AcnA [Methanosarcina sp. KYL-1]|uniref:aconitate hydratase AcnA n=1 Tax=Methanosarcina sp. KYL-1 TaxID=2602068 RepID=UPI00210102F0|nr:aconitate hydratase AcnA [Methanosarcina sp. KYL-1]MCQ1534687.1 aconitate hydratase AcnA [Methanosarcina sp. KYL-1]
MRVGPDPFGVRDSIETTAGEVTVYRLKKLEEQGFEGISLLPYSIRILLESLLRHADTDRHVITEEDVEALARWSPENISERDIPFIPSRVILQDFTGVPAVVDIAALRSAMKRLGGDPGKINPVIPADLVIDHSVQVDYYGTAYSLKENEKKEFERNTERYSVLRWAQEAFDNFRVVPPGRGIIHQVNLEYLTPLVHLKEKEGELVAFPDTLVGTDSHTTMINGIGVLGWGVGGIEAEAVMLGQPYYMPVPEVVGFKLYGKLEPGVTATDLVLTITQMLRKHGVVGKFVEYYGPGLSSLSLPDRATISNMAPEYGATLGIFPPDAETLDYLRRTGRSEEQVALVKKYLEAQGLLYSIHEPEPIFSSTLELDMGTVKPCLAGPKRPQDRIPIGEMPESFHETMRQTFARKKETGVDLNRDPAYQRWTGEGGGQLETGKPYVRQVQGYAKYTETLEKAFKITHGSVVIASITSCTNTSNPSVLIGAGLLAKKAVEMGLRVKPYVKTSLSPGSRVATEYLKASGLLPYLEALGFHQVGYGCTTCIGNSGPLPEYIAKEVEEKDLTVAAVLSGNRNFEGRINPLVRANYLASPPLVVAYSISGTVDINMETEPLAYDPNGNPVYLKDIWPAEEEIKEVIKSAVKPSMFEKEYSGVLEGTELWKELDVPTGTLYEWNPKSTYIQEPPYFVDFPLTVPEPGDVRNARVLALFGDSITTDHISPAGDIAEEGAAGKYLISWGVDPEDFNSFGSRRGNHEVMMRGTFGNIRLRNRLVPREGSWTVYHLHEGSMQPGLPEEMTIYDAAMLYADNNVPLIVIAGKEYGTGSSRDWAAKGTFLLGVKAVIAESFERIHRSNLVGMGVLPLQFKEWENSETLGLTGKETYDILGIESMEPGGELTVRARDEKGGEIDFKVTLRLDSAVEIEYYKNGGILHRFLRDKLKEK